mmetsp:Transcript_10887/g.23905  ORF Transcript_10887/g.23905 Transcript_10887/m.23905 type:complete len:111 (-) Transcript_10887:23-355(-)
MVGGRCFRIRVYSRKVGSSAYDGAEELPGNFSCSGGIGVSRRFCSTAEGAAVVYHGVYRDGLDGIRTNGSVSAVGIVRRNGCSVEESAPGDLEKMSYFPNNIIIELDKRL